MHNFHVNSHSSVPESLRCELFSKGRFLFFWRVDFFFCLLCVFLCVVVVSLFLVTFILFFLRKYRIFMENIQIQREIGFVFNQLVLYIQRLSFYWVWDFFLYFCLISFEFFFWPRFGLFKAVSFNGWLFFTVQKWTPVGFDQFSITVIHFYSGLFDEFRIFCDSALVTLFFVLLVILKINFLERLSSHSIFVSILFYLFADQI